MTGDGVVTDKKVIKQRKRSQRNKIATGTLLFLGGIPQVLKPLESMGVVPPFTTELVVGLGGLVGAVINHCKKT